MEAVGLVAAERPRLSRNQTVTQQLQVERVVGSVQVSADPPGSDPDPPATSALQQHLQGHGGQTCQQPSCSFLLRLALATSTSGDRARPPGATGGPLPILLEDRSPWGAAGARLGQDGPCLRQDGLGRRSFLLVRPSVCLLSSSISSDLGPVGPCQRSSAALLVVFWCPLVDSPRL